MSWRRGKKSNPADTPAMQGATAGPRPARSANSISSSVSRRSTGTNEIEASPRLSVGENDSRLIAPVSMATESAFRKGKPEHTVNSLISKAVIPVREDSGDLCDFTHVGFHDGDQSEDGPDLKCVIGLLPSERMSPGAVKTCPHTFQWFQDDLRIKGWGWDRLNSSVSTVARLMDSMYCKINPDCDFGFRKNGMTTEVGKPTHDPGVNRDSSWGAIMTLTKDTPPWMQGRRYPWDPVQFNRIWNGYESQVRYKQTRTLEERMNSGSSVRRGEASAHNDTMTAEGNTQNLDRNDKLSIFDSAFFSHHVSPSRKDEYHFLICQSSESPVITSSGFTSVDDRETTPEAEERFIRNFDTMREPLSILLDEGVSDIQYHCVTNDGYGIELKEMYRDGLRYWQARMRDDKSGESS